MEEKVGNRVIPIVSVLAVIVIMIILTLTRNASANGPAAATLADEGERIYLLICASCHAPDPSVDRGASGTYGPAVAGSSMELLRMRVLDTKYPEGYTPKRDTRLMTPFPTLTNQQLQALHAFLNRPEFVK